MKFLKQFYLNKYQIINRNIAVFAGEYEKVARFLNNFVSLATLLAVRNVNIPTWVLVFSYILVMVIANYAGGWLVNLGVMKVGNTIGNEQNNELMKILKNQEEILRILKSNQLKSNEK